MDTAYWDCGPQGCLVTISPCSIIQVPESARNHARTYEILPLIQVYNTSKLQNTTLSHKYWIHEGNTAGVAILHCT